MSELHKFLFDGLPVRGMVVRLTDAWQEILRRRHSNPNAEAYPEPVRDMLGEMVAAAALMQSSIRFDGALVLQVFGDGPVKVAVVEVQHDLSLRATAKVVGDLPPGAQLSDLVNANNQGRCAITLDPKAKFPGQQPYQGVVPMFDDRGEKIERLSEVLEHYMLQSEQLDTTLVLAADDRVAAGLLIQRLPVQGERNLEGQGKTPGLDGVVINQANEDEIGLNEHYNRISLLAASLQREELLTLDVDTILRRLFWEEQVLRLAPQDADIGPRFACTCSRARVGNMIRSLGSEEAESIIAERGDIEVGCDFCGQYYWFDAIDAAQLFTDAGDQAPGSSAVQ